MSTDPPRRKAPLRPGRQQATPFALRLPSEVKQPRQTLFRVTYESIQDEPGYVTFTKKVEIHQAPALAEQAFNRLVASRTVGFVTVEEADIDLDSLPWRTIDSKQKDPA